MGRFTKKGDFSNKKKVCFNNQFYVYGLKVMAFI